MDREPYQSKKTPKNTDSMISRNYWLVFRMRALEAGFVPPLLPSKIPPEWISLFQKEDPADIVPFVESEEIADEKPKQTIFRRLWMSLFVGLLLIVGASYSYHVREKNSYRVGLLDALLPSSTQVEMVKDAKNKQ